MSHGSGGAGQGGGSLIPSCFQTLHKIQTKLASNELCLCGSRATTRPGWRRWSDGEGGWERREMLVTGRRAPDRTGRRGR